MRPKGMDGVITAGRCISATQKAQGTIRIMGCVMSQGEAAGTAAGLCIKHKTPRKLPIKTLIDALEAGGGSISGDGGGGCQRTC